MVSILEDDNPIAELEVEALLAVGVSVVLGDPKAAALVPTKGDGLTDVRLSREERGGEPLGEMELGQRIRGLQQRDGLWLVIVRLRKRRGPQSQGKE